MKNIITGKTLTRKQAVRQLLEDVESLSIISGKKPIEVFKIMEKGWKNEIKEKLEILAGVQKSINRKR